MIAFGVLAAVEIGRRRWEKRGGNGDDIAEIAKWAVPAGLIGARMYHVATDWKSYQGRWLDAFKIWNGGLGIPGGLLLGIAVGYWFVRKRGWNVPLLLESIVPGIPVAQAIGRLGNWFNQEIYGQPSDLPWAVAIDAEYRPNFPDDTTFHPTFLYEGLWNLGLAGLLIWVSNRKLIRPVQVLPLWIMGYGVGRFLIELMRTDAASEILGLRVNTWVSGIAVFGGLLAFVLLRGDSAAEEVGAEEVDSDAVDSDDVDDTDVDVDEAPSEA